MSKKWHKNCGGKIIRQKPEFKAHFSEAGKCLKCREFPITEENIIFEINEHEVERFFDNKEIKSWRIVRKDQLKEVLEV